MCIGSHLADRFGCRSDTAIEGEKRKSSSYFSRAFNRSSLTECSTVFGLGQLAQTEENRIVFLNGAD